METGSVFLQVFLAIVLVIIFLVIGFLTYNSEMLNAVRDSGKTRIVTPLFKGIIDLKGFRDGEFSTLDGTDPTDPSFRNLADSVNQQAGTEFAYNFWLYLDPRTQALKNSASPVSGKTTFKPDMGLTSDQLILFMRGSNKVVTYNKMCNDNTTKSDVFVKCPLVKLENGADVLTVEFNTTESADAVIANSRNTCSETSTNWSNINSYKIGIKGMSNIKKQWMMVTVVIQGTYPSDPLVLRNKARCTIYVNGSQQLDKYVDGKLVTSTDPEERKTPSIVRTNKGNLYVNPVLEGTYLASPATGTKNTLANKEVMMADLTYFNYVPSEDEINALYTEEFTKSYAPTVQAGTKENASADSFMKNLSSAPAINSMTAVGA